MQKLLLLAVIILTAINCKSQEVIVYQPEAKPITIIQNKNKSLYYQNNIHLSINQMLGITVNNQEAYKYIIKAKKLNITANVFASIGGFCLGYGLGNLIFGMEKITWILFGTCIGFIGFTIPFVTTAGKNVNKGVSIYNNTLEEIEKPVIGMELGMTSNGIGFVLTF
ncbi:MAG: hypothetical protein LBP67_08790 [Bacteroidales bacterium]|jgi:hypothetical protein|nr:hypothetical protein [Bacteroidales bacterium]